MGIVTVVNEDDVGEVKGKLRTEKEVEHVPGSGVFMKLKQIVEEKTLAGAAVTFTSPPAGAIVISCTAVVTDTITGASGFDLGDGTDEDRWGAIDETAIGQKAGPGDQTASGLISFGAAPVLTATARTSDFTGGKLKVSCLYWELQGVQA